MCFHLKNVTLVVILQCSLLSRLLFLFFFSSWACFTSRTLHSTPLFGFFSSLFSHFFFVCLDNEKSVSLFPYFSFSPSFLAIAKRRMADCPTRRSQNTESAAAVVMTEKLIVEQCKKHNGYSTPELNEKLYLHRLGFSELNALSAFTGCTVLYLNHNALSRLDGLAALPQLDSLYLSCNALTSLDTLPPLPTLRTLDVAENAITTLRGLDQAAPQLQTLLAGHNRLTQLAGLQGCTALLSLDLSHNLLDDEEKADAVLRPLRGSLRTLLLHGNELCRRTPHYRKRWIAAFATLRYLDEYPVFDEERERAEAFALGGAAAEDEARHAQRARADEEAQARFRYYGELRNASRQARQRDGPSRAPTAYFVANATPQQQRPPAIQLDDDDDVHDVYIPFGHSCLDVN